MTFMEKEEKNVCKGKVMMRDEKSFAEGSFELFRIQVNLCVLIKPMWPYDWQSQHKFLKEHGILKMFYSHTNSGKESRIFQCQAILEKHVF